MREDKDKKSETKRKDSKEMMEIDLDSFSSTLTQ
jgi:hypothetical protein